MAKEKQERSKILADQAEKEAEIQRFGLEKQEKVKVIAGSWRRDGDGAWRRDENDKNL